MAIIIKPPVSGGGGGGAVDSVNGATGVVVLTTDNIDAGSNADRQYFTTSIQSDIDGKASSGDLSALDGRLTTAEGEIDTLQGDLSTAQTDILSVQSKTLYSHSHYVNDGVNDIQAVLDDIAGDSGINAIYLSVGSYGGSTVSISNHTNVNIIAPESPTGVHGCELVSRGLTISGASTTRIKIENLNIEGAVVINGTEGRHYFKNVIFDSTVTITDATSNFITFEQCSFAGGISIASTVTATVYFDRCTMGNQLVSSLRAGAGSPLLTILTECSGVNASQVNLTSNVVLVGRTGFNDLSVVQYQNSDSYVYDLNNGLSTSFSGSYTELRNKPTIPSAYTDEQARDAAGTALANGTHTGISFVNDDGSDTIDATVSLAGFSTDDLSQGSTNKYFSDTLARGAFTAGAGISITTGTIASTITQYTDADADSRITAQKGQANGICELDANSLVPTNHLPPLAITDVHVVADATERLALTVQEGDVAIQTDDSSAWIYSGSAWVQFSTGGAVLSVNGQTGTVSLDTDDVTEGATNKYFSNTLARGAFTAGTGISITTGTIASTITQYTDTLAKTASVVDSMAGTQTDQAPSVSSVKAYYTAGTGISLTGGTIASTITQYTDELAQDASASLFTGGTHAGITYTYDDVSNKIDSTVSISGNALTWPTVALNTGTTSVSVGNYYYTSTNLQGSAYTLTPPSPGKNGDVLYIHNNGGNTISFGPTAYYFNGAYSGTGQTFTSSENDVFVCTRFGTSNVWFISKQVSQARYTDASARTASVVNSMAGSQTTQAPSVSSVKSYYTAGTGITLTSGTIASTITQYTDELAQDASASLLTTGTHTGISYSYVDGSNKIDSTVSLASFSIDALSDVDTSTTSPTGGQALAWDGTSKWVPTTISGGGGASRIAITNQTESFAISDPVSASVIEEHYTMDSTSATTFTLPTAVGNNGLTYDITNINTGVVTIATVNGQTISGLGAIQLTSQWQSATIRSTGSNWIIK